MKNIRINSTFIDLVKRGACTLLTAILITLPHIGHTETETKTNINNETRIEQTINNTDNEEVDNPKVTVSISDLNDLEETKSSIEKAIELADGLDTVSENPSFVLVTHWEKSENYDKGKDYSKGNREYKRTIYRFKANENFNAEYFENDIEKMIKFFRDEENSAEIFDVIESFEQVINVTPEEEKKLNTAEDIIEIEGTNLIIKIDSKETEEVEKAKKIIRIIGFVLIYIGYTGVIVTRFRK